jgi:hypothetical protein
VAVLMFMAALPISAALSWPPPPLFLTTMKLLSATRVSFSRRTMPYVMPVRAASMHTIMMMAPMASRL